MNGNSPYFSKLKIDLHKVVSKNDLTNTLKERSSFISAGRKLHMFIFSSRSFKEKVNITEESLKITWKGLDLMKNKYLPTFLNQYYFNCADILRTESLNTQYIIDVKIEDDIVKAPLESRNEVMSNYIFIIIRKWFWNFT